MHKEYVIYTYLFKHFGVQPGFYLGFFVWGRSQFEWQKARSILGESKFFGNGYVLRCNLVHLNIYDSETQR